MARRPLNTYLFDLDGTLIDSIELILSSYRHMMTVHRGEVPPDWEWLKQLGTPLRRQLRAFSNDPDEIDAMVATYREHNATHHDAMVRPYPGVLQPVRELRAKGFKLAIVTSKLRDGSLRGLAVCGFDGLFDVILTAEDVIDPKPHPEPVLRALKLLDVEADTTVFIGDSPHDLASGRSAGVRTAAVLWGPFNREHLAPHSPDYWLSTPAEIRSVH